MELFGSRTVWMEQTTSSSRENHPSFWGSQCLQHRAPWSSTGDRSRAAMFGASGTDGFILSRAINVDCVALQAQAGAGFGSLVLCKENACYLPSQPKAGETESSAFQISLPRQGSLSPWPRPRTPSRSRCLPPQALTDPEIDVSFSSAQHQDILQLLPLGLCGRCAGVLWRAVQYTPIQGC